MTSEKAVSLIALRAHDIPDVFRAEAHRRGRARRSPRRLQGREDWRDLPLVTIDPPDAKDHDDAVHAEPDTAPDNDGGFILTVAIADVACLCAARARRSTRTRWSAAIRSISPTASCRCCPSASPTTSARCAPNEDRPALAVRMRVTAKGKKIDHSFHRVMMRSHAKLTYAQAQAAIDGTPDETTKPLLDTVLQPLYAAHEALQHARNLRAPLDLDLPERKILLKPDGTFDRVDHSAAARSASADRGIHDPRQCRGGRDAGGASPACSSIAPMTSPRARRSRRSREFLATIGVKLAKGQVLRPAHFNVHPGAREGHGAREHRQRDRSAHAGAGRIYA